jgi:hypothetical protein
VPLIVRTTLFELRILPIREHETIPKERYEGSAMKDIRHDLGMIEESEQSDENLEL